MRKLAVLALCLLALSWSPATAEGVFVSNQPFKGRVFGLGQDVRVGLEDLAKALGMSLQQVEGAWQMEGRPLETLEEHGLVWVRLDRLPKDLVRVVRHVDFGTIDLYRVENPGASSSQWGGAGTLVVFTTNWCPTTQAMRGTLSELERSQVLHVAYVDVEAPAGAVNAEYDHLFEGDKIPYFVLLDRRGTRVHAFVGFHTYTEMLSTIRKHLKTDDL